MTARERAEAVVRDTIAAPGLDSTPAGLAAAVLNALEDSLLLVVAMPEAPYDVTPAGPYWLGDGFAVLVREDGSLLVAYEPILPGPIVRLTPTVAAAISAAHIRAEDYR